MSLATLAVAAFVGALLLGAGYLVRYQKAVALVPGFDPDRVGDPAALAEFLGAVYLVAGAATVGVGAVDYVGVDGPLWEAYAVALVVLLVVAVAGWRRA